MENNWTRIKKGKTRDLWQSKNGRCVALFATDRVSANDAVLEDVTIPNKGKLQTEISNNWCLLTDKVVPNAVLTTDVNEMPRCWRNSYFAGRTTEMIALKMVPIEAVVRGYVAGSMWEKYRNGVRKFGNCTLPDALLEAMRLPMPLYTPTTKAPAGEHDQELDFEETIAVIEQAGFDEPRKLAEQVRDYALLLYAYCSEYAKERGIILADTKFEFGVDEKGILRVADEVCTFDSSRFWLASDYKIGHRQNNISTFIVRDYVKEHAGEPIPAEILEQTSKAYRFLLDRLFSGKETAP